MSRPTLIRLTVVVAIDLAALGITAGQGDAAQLQGARIGDSNMTVNADQKY